MSREEYLEQLKKYLRRLPVEDYENAIEYFNEYFEDAGRENEQKVMEELGSPQEAAAELLSNLLSEKTSHKTSGEEKKKASVGSILLITGLVILAAPLGTPLFIMAMVLLLMGILMIVLTVMIAAVFSITTIAAGVKLLIRAIVAIPTSISGACLIAGLGLTGIGVGICLFILEIYLCKWIAYGVGRAGQCVVKKTKKEGLADE